MSKYFQLIVCCMVLFFGTDMTSAFAHNSVTIGPYEIEVGWKIEPPIERIRNDIVFKIIEHGEREGTYTGIANAFKNLEVNVKHGGVDKTLDINSDQRLGYYYSSIIPTQTGSYSVDIKGKLIDTNVDSQIALEDVESSAVLNFPFVSQSNFDNESLEKSVKLLQNEILNIKSDSQHITNSDTSMSNNFVVLALSLSTSAVIISIIAMTKKY